MLCPANQDVYTWRAEFLDPDKDFPVRLDLVSASIETAIEEAKEFLKLPFALFRTGHYKFIDGQFSYYRAPILVFIKEF